jgi:hypothetical protein
MYAWQFQFYTYSKEKQVLHDLADLRLEELAICGSSSRAAAFKDAASASRGDP